MGHLAAAELELHAHLVALVEELLGVAHLRHVIVLGAVHAKLDFLELAARVFLVLFLLGRLVFEFAEIDDPADRRIGVGGDLDEVEPEFLGLADGVGQLHDTELFAGGRQDHTHFAGADPAIDTILDLNRETSFPARTWSRRSRWVVWFSFRRF